ncbi:hypothetical protein [Pseudomonas asplenii]|uniref:GpW protein n=1 Tax=Pseudomonas asplenii TaxID=53407 RepID=A0A1H6P0U0_9PSED|nr:hypothetical protein [Pseudomonas fuscovaginae]SEI17176.1 hypothetical protein SAMN05216581_3324 [Pseudomonas fuscovaginae]
MTQAQEQLAAVQAAIAKVLKGGQSVRYGDRQVTRADLGMLRKLEKDYSAQVQAEQQKKRGRNRISYMSI